MVNRNAAVVPQHTMWTLCNVFNQFVFCFMPSGSLSPSCLVMEVLWMLCERTECAADCLHQTAVIETLLTPVVALLNAQQVRLQHTLTHTLCADRNHKLGAQVQSCNFYLHSCNRTPQFPHPHSVIQLCRSPVTIH